MTLIEKAAKKASKIKFEAPKRKHLEVLLDATQEGEQIIGEIFRVLQYRLAETSWTIVIKALTVTHILIREGHGENVIRFLSNYSHAKNTLSTPGITLLSTHGKFISYYSLYLQQRTKFFAEFGWDAAKVQKKFPSFDQNLLSIIEAIQSLTARILHCKINKIEADDVVLAAFRLILSEILILFQNLNEGVIEMLRHYFEMNKINAERALDIYKYFVIETDEVVKYLDSIKFLESRSGILIPEIKHAPVGLTLALEDYLNAKDFEKNRQNILNQKNNKKLGFKAADPPLENSQTALINLIDNFEEKSDRVQLPQAIVYPQTTGLINSNLNGLVQTQTGFINTNFTGLVNNQIRPGMQVVAFNNSEQYINPYIPPMNQDYNPFRQSSMITGLGQQPIFIQPPQQQYQTGLNQQQFLQQFSPHEPVQSIYTQKTGNPFTKRKGENPFSNLASKNHTGSSNPFKKDQKNNYTMGGLEDLETIPIFSQAQRDK